VKVANALAHLVWKLEDQRRLGDFGGFDLAAHVYSVSR